MEKLSHFTKFLCPGVDAGEWLRAKSLSTAKVFPAPQNTKSTFKLFSHSICPNFLRAYGLQHIRLLCPSHSPRICSNSCSLSQWCHANISSSVTPILLLPSISLSLSLFQLVGSLHHVAKVLELQLQHQCFQWIFRVDFL